MTHTETRISNERLIAEATEMCRHPNVHFHYSDGPRVMMALVQALRAPIEAEPISWLSFNDDGEPYLTGNQAEMIKLEATGPGPHALYARPLPNPSPSDGEVSGEWQDIATAPKDWSDVLVFAPDFPSDFRNVGEAYHNPETGKWRTPASRRKIHPTYWQPLPQPPEAGKP